MMAMATFREFQPQHTHIIKMNDARKNRRAHVRSLPGVMACYSCSSSVNLSSIELRHIMHVMPHAIKPHWMTMTENQAM